MPKKKQAAPIEEIIFPQHYFVCGADLSLRRPGFCLIEVDDVDNKPSIVSVKLASIDNKTKRKKTHGEILREIMDCFIGFISKDNMNKYYFVREKMIMNKKVPSERDVAKVVGIMDYYLSNEEWYEIYPVTVKRLIAGSGQAEKTTVAASLKDYIGEHAYRNDDESDAAAVAVAWLIQNKQIKEIQR